MLSFSIREAATAVVLLTPLTFAACATDALEPGGATTPVYNKNTGRLEQIVSDRNRDGRVETRAFMDGAQLQRIEIDRNADGQPDRWEYYLPAAGDANAAPDSRPAQIERAEESNGTGGKITRREFYVNGLLAKVDEDTDADGRVDKWERYEAGILRQVDLDLQGKGFADRRLIYGAAGEMAQVEVDTAGTGRFVAIGAVGGGR